MTALLNTVLAGAFALAGTAVVYIGVSFINAQLLTESLGWIYERTGVFARSIIMLIVLATPGNVMISYVYRFVDPATAGMVLIAALAIVLTAKALLMGVDGLGWRAAAAGTATTLSLIWLAWELSRAH